jgi:hypothetical protein
MKTSNKILLGVFLVIILLTTTVQLIVYAKYKRGEYVAFNRDVFNKMISFKVPSTRFVSLMAVGNCTITYDDKPRFEVREDKVSLFSYRVVNDTLIIHGDSTITKEQMERGERDNRQLKLYLPATVQITMAYSGLTAEGAIDSAHAPSYSINLTKKSYFNVRGEKKDYQYFNQLILTGEKSRIDLDDHVVVNDLNLKVVNCEINNKKAVIKNMALDMDNKSTITLSGSNIKALK